MKKKDALKFLNPILFLLFAYQAGTGILHSTIPYRFFVMTHGKVGYVLAGAVLVHIWLNWGWIKSTFLPRNKQS